LEKIVFEAVRRAPLDEQPLLAWPVVCGAPLAEKTQAVAFRDGVLEVQVPDAAWKEELTGLAPRVLGALNAVSRAPVTRIEFVSVEGKKKRT
jgi:predicted nucleic acid-binding Zn ribbon protein